MQVTQTKNDGLSYEFQITVPANDVASAVEAKLGQISKQVKMPGFRPGKVPMNIVRDRYAQSARGEVVESLVQQGTQTALKDKGLRAASQPKIELTGDIYNATADLAYTMVVEVLPKIEPMDVTTLQLTRPMATADAAAVEERIQLIASQLKGTEPAPAGQAAANGDTLVIDFEGSVDGDRRPDMAAQKFALELGSNSLIPGFEEQLLGMKAGESRTIEVTFPADYHAGEIAGKAAKFDVTAGEVRVPAAPTLDDDFAKRVGAKDMASLRTGVQNSIQADYEQMSRGRVKRQLLDQLAAAHTFPVPASMVEAEFNGIWRQIEADKEAGKLDEEDRGKDEATLKADYHAIAERRVRLGLLLAELGQQLKVQVTNQDLQTAVRNEAMKYPGQEAKIVEFYSKTPQAVQQLQATAFEEKTVDAILAKATVTEETVSAATLMQGDEG